MELEHSLTQTLEIPQARLLLWISSDVRDHVATLPTYDYRQFKRAS